MKTITLLIAILFLNFYSFSQNAACLSADLTKDGVVDQADYLLFLPAYGSTCVSGQPCPTDLNLDGVTNQLDFLIFIPQYGKRCEAVIFDISHAVYTTGYVEVPVSISSASNLINALDFNMTFNENKLTYNSLVYPTIGVHIDGYAYFHPVDRHLRFTGDTYPQYLSNNTKVLSIRFATNSTIIPADFHLAMPLLNGVFVGTIVK